MSLRTNIVRRRAIYYFRCRVPADLRTAVGRMELTRSLRTSCRFSAIRLASPLYTKTARLWRDLRQAMTQDEINHLLGSWLSHALENDKTARADTSFAEDRARRNGTAVHDEAAALWRWDAETRLEEWQQVVERHDWAAGEHLANVVIEQHNLKIAKESDAYRMLRMGLCLASLDLEGVRVERSMGRWGAKPQLFADVPTPQAGAVADTRPTSLGVSKPLGAAIAEFVIEVQKTRGYRPKRIMDFNAALKLLARHLGEDRPISGIAKKDIGEFRSLLTKLPTNFTKRFPDLDLAAIVAKAEECHLATLTPQTINGKYLAIVHEFFAWCVSCGDLDENPAKDVRVKQAKSRVTKSRGTFKQRHLTHLFAAPLYTGCKSVGRIYEPGDHRVRDHRYWLPLLGLWTGARLGELCQLLLSDIREIDGVWCLEIKAGGEKHVKSRAAERQVPIHPELKQLGFIEHVQQLQREGIARLFPEIEPGAGGYLSDTISKWFGRLLRLTLGKEAVGADGLMFHSFRHTVKDALRAAGVDERVQDALIGHETDHVSSQYGDGYQVPRLFAEISKMQHEGLDLSGLYPASTARNEAQRLHEASESAFL
jgi:integrase